MNDRTLIVHTLVASLLKLGSNGKAYELGCTVGKEDSKLIFDASFGQDTYESNYYVLSGMYQIMDGLRIGLGYD